IAAARLGDGIEGIGSGSRSWHASNIFPYRNMSSTIFLVSLFLFGPSKTAILARPGHALKNPHSRLNRFTAVHLLSLRCPGCQFVVGDGIRRLREDGCGGGGAVAFAQRGA